MWQAARIIAINIRLIGLRSFTELKVVKTTLVRRRRVARGVL
jgi:hypothetical protein